MNERFNKSLKKFDRYFIKLGIKYNMEPHLDTDDIYQICLTKLNEVVDGTDFDIESNSFEALTKTLVKNAVIDEMRKFQSQSRDRTKEIHSIPSSDPGDDSQSSIIDSLKSIHHDFNPEIDTLYNDFVARIRSRLTELELKLFEELTNPCSASWDLIDKRIESGKSWTKPTYEMIASTLGISIGKMRCALYSLREKVHCLLKSCPTCGTNNINREMIKDDKWYYGCDNLDCSNNDLFIPILVADIRI